MSNSSKTFAIRYDSTSAVYAGQTIVNANANEVIIDFSSGPIPGGEEQILPVHTRVAMTVDSAKRLARLLQQATEPTSNDQARIPNL